MHFPSDLHGVVIYPASWAKTRKDRWLSVRDHYLKDLAKRGLREDQDIGPQRLELAEQIGGTIFSSPNDRPYPLRHNRAASKLFSQRQKDFMLAGDLSARRHTGLTADQEHNNFTHYHGIGSWENSVEPAMVTAFHKPVTALQLQKIGADVGTWARQHGILVFSPHPEGTEQLMHMRIPTHTPSPVLDPHTISNISRRVTAEFNKYVDPGDDPQYWMPGRTILPDTNGHSDVLVWVPPWAENPSRLHDAFMQIAENLEGKRPQFWPGQGLLLGGTSPYSDEETKHFTDAQRRTAAIANYQRALEAKKSNLIDPRSVRPQKLDRGSVRSMEADKSNFEPEMSEKSKFLGVQNPESNKDENTPWDDKVNNARFNIIRQNYVTPDDLFGSRYGEPEETFVAINPNDESSIYRGEGHDKHYQLLENMRQLGMLEDFGSSPSDEPHDFDFQDNSSSPSGNRYLTRDSAVGHDMVVGRTGDVYGQRIMAFWNRPHQAEQVRDFVNGEIQRGLLDPINDWVSFRGAGKLMRAGDFVNYYTPKPDAPDWTPEELAAKHVNPLLKALILGEQAKSKKTEMQQAAEDIGFVRPGQKYWAPLSEQMHGEPMQLEVEREPKQPKKSKRTRSPSKVGMVVRGVYYQPGKLAPGIIQAEKQTSFRDRLMDYARRRHKGKPVATSDSNICQAHSLQGCKKCQ